jgi:hypothetical protein
VVVVGFVVLVGVKVLLGVKVFVAVLLKGFVTHHRKSRLQRIRLRVEKLETRPVGAEIPPRAKTDHPAERPG